MDQVTIGLVMVIREGSWGAKARITIPLGERLTISWSDRETRWGTFLTVDGVNHRA